MIDDEYFWKSAFPLGALMLKNTLNLEMPISREMQELRVLEVNHITTRVPSSLKFMIKLHTLSLDYCRLDGDFAGIGSLKMLRVLSFFHSIVEIFPMEIAELTNLQCLDLRFEFKSPSTFLCWTLTNLKELEELYLGNIVSLDIESLKNCRLSSKLHTIQFVVDSDSCFEGLLRKLNLSKLIRFHIVRDLEDGGEIEYQIRQNVLELHQKSVHMNLNLLKELIRRVEWFHLNGRGLTHVVDVLGEDNGFQNVKDLKLRNCDMKYLVDATNHLAKGNFSRLETLKIHYARKLEELIHGDNPGGILNGQHAVRLKNLNVGGSFQSPLGHLRRLEIFSCDKIKTLFSKSMVNCLERLEYMEIKLCPMFERIVRIQKVQEVNCSQVSEFPKLKHLTLNGLPEFRDLGHLSDEVMFSKLEHLTIMLSDTHIKKERVAEVCSYLGSSLPKVRYLDIKNCNNLLTIATSGLVHGFEDLQTLRVRACSSVEVVFDFEEIMRPLSAETPEANLLARLEEFDLSNLPKLEHICTMVPEGTSVFSNLKKIQVKGCNNLRYLLTPSMKMLVHLEELELQDNKLMEAIIGSDEHGGDDSTNMSIALRELRKITVHDLQKLGKLCLSPDLKLELPSFTELHIINCPVDILTRRNLALQNLRKIKVEKCGNFDYLFTSVGQVLVHLEELELRDNHSMYTIFGDPRTKPYWEDIPTRSIVLPKLRKLEISNLRNFRMLCSPENLNVELPSLARLCIEDCPEMKQLCVGKLSAPHLISVKYRSKEIALALKDCESMTRCLDCIYDENYDTCYHHLEGKAAANDEYLHSTGPPSAPAPLVPAPSAPAVSFTDPKYEKFSIEYEIDPNYDRFAYFSTTVSSHGRSNNNETADEHLHSAYSSLAYTDGSRSTGPPSASAPSGPLAFQVPFPNNMQAPTSQASSSRAPLSPLPSYEEFFSYSSTLSNRPSGSGEDN